MTTEREALLAKIRGLLAKTVENGCTEAEAFAALDKARAWMDAHEVTEEELRLTEKEAAIIRAYSRPNDKYDIRFTLAEGVAEFTGCEYWRQPKLLKEGRRNQYEWTTTFCGLPSDVDLAHGLLATLEGFVRHELVNHLLGDQSAASARRQKINGFVDGCCSRINQRLHELVEQSKARASTNGKALIVVKSAAIAEKMKADGIRIRYSGGGTCRQTDNGSYAAGRAAGDRASFSRGRIAAH
jgi:Protein of unknown function (DUF2786)